MFNIVIVGVGGQGTLLASKILGQLAMNNGYEVRVSEVHGMSQRGGSVVTYVRISNDQPLYSSIVEQGQADIVLAFEDLEALRALPYLKSEGTMVVNTQKILPMPVITGAAKYPEDCLERVENACKTIKLNAVEIAHECGTYKAANVVLMGVVAKMLPFPVEEWHKAIEQCVKPKFLEINIFMSGRIRIFKQSIIQTHFRLDSIRSRHPMQGTFHLPVTCRSGTATGIRIIRTMNCRDISLRILLHAFTLHDISTFQANLITQSHPEEFFRSILHKIIPFDI